MARAFATLCAVSFLVLLAGCGFRPLYGGGTGGVASRALESISIDPIPDRIGQIVHNNLLDRLNPRGEPAQPRYRLSVTVSVSSKGLAIRKDEAFTRANLRLRANYELFNAQNGEKLLAGSTFSIAAYNLVQSDFANLSAQRDAQIRTARQVSDDIRNRLAQFLRDKLTS
jgi:LPS-assembly lipoprotein